jgi:MFS transporter, putative metabolite:H+ symporter
MASPQVPAPGETSKGPTRLSPYQRRLFAFLSVATFFEGYDFFAITQLLPELRDHFGLGHGQSGLMLGFINSGTILAFLLVRRADAWGRKRVLSVTILGYTLCTLLTAVAPNVYAFAAFQMVARIFLLGEYALSMMMAAEEMPADRRGTVIGVITAMAILGSVLCAGLVPFLAKATPFGWRAVYAAGIVPLLIVAYARRNLRETVRFEQQVEKPKEQPLLRIWSTPHRRRMLELGLIWFLTYLGTQNAVAFWKDFAVNERSLTAKQVSLSISLAAVLSLPIVFSVGKLLDRWGRRKTAALVFTVTAVAIFFVYSLHGWLPLTFALMAGIVGVGSVLPVLNSYTAELFPTAYRGDAFAWSNNILGRIGYTLAPAVVGAFAEVFGLGPTLRVTAIFPLLSLAFILFWLPETRGKELEETSTL